MIELRFGTGEIGEYDEYLGPPYNYIPLPLLGDTGMTDVIFCPWCRDLYLQIVVAGMGSTDEVTVTVEGSLDNENWDELNATGAATTINTNGTTLMYYAEALPPYVRVRIVWASGVLETATIQVCGYMQSIS